MTGIIDLSQFAPAKGLLDGSSWMVVVKSQDQIQRRARLLATRTRGKYGRLAARPTAIGLLLKGTFAKGRFNIEWKREFREPRHIVPFGADHFLLTDVGQVNLLDRDGDIVRTYHHPFFSFLHTVQVSPDGKRALIVASGYDVIFEIDLDSGEESFAWWSWDHGFNPDEDGVWLTTSAETLKRYQREGKPCLLINPKDFGETGLLTARRSAHPNAARYDPYDDHRSMIVSLGHDGKLFRVRFDTGETTSVTDALDQMPHGLVPWENGWAMTNTTTGEWRLFDKTFIPLKIFRAATLGGKATGTQEVEWIQQVVPLDRNRLLFLDANRGLYAIDIRARLREPYDIDPNYALQDALPLH